MKWILAFSMVLFFQNGGVGQVVAIQRDWFKIAMQDTTFVRFDKVDDDFLYFTKDGGTRKVKKTACEGWFQFDYADAEWPMVDGEVVWQWVIPVDSMKAEEVYLSAKLWFAHAYNSGKDVVQVDDKESATVQGKGWSQVVGKVFMGAVVFKMWHSVKIEGKDGRFRMLIFDIKLEGEPNQYDRNPQAYPIKDCRAFAPKNEPQRSVKREIFERMEGLYESALKEIASPKKIGAGW